MMKPKVLLRQRGSFGLIRALNPQLKPPRYCHKRHFPTHFGPKEFLHRKNDFPFMRQIEKWLLPLSLSICVYLPLGPSLVIHVLYTDLHPYKNGLDIVTQRGASLRPSELFAIVFVFWPLTPPFIKIPFKCHVRAPIYTEK